MLARRIIPCLDIRDGRVVKGIKFQNLRDAGDPVECAQRYEQEGADELVLLDVSATTEGRAHALDTVRAVRAVLRIPLTVGGGVRSAEDVGRLLNAGADRVGVNSAAVDNPAILSDTAQQFGRQCTVISIDAACRLNAPDPGQPQLSDWEVVVASGKRRTKRDALEWAREAVELGAGEILLTSLDRDGTREGYDLELLRAVCSIVSVPVVASGGADRPEHLIEALEVGAHAVLAASIFHSGETTVRAVKERLAEAGVIVRP